MKPRFMPPYGSWFAWFAKKSIFIWWLTTIVSLVLIIFFWYYSIYFPIQKFITNRIQIHSLDTLNKLTTTVAMLHKELAPYTEAAEDQNFSTTQELYQKNLLQLLHCFHDMKLALIECTTEKLHILNGIAKVPFTCTVLSTLNTYAQIVQMFVEKQIPLLCKKIICTLQSPDQYQITIVGEFVFIDKKIPSTKTAEGLGGNNT
jgi:hypothetical protein